jgi:hypothetical protein
LEESTTKEQIENLEVEKPESETSSNVSAKNRINHIAEEAAEKASRTEQEYDGEHNIFSK